MKKVVQRIMSYFAVVTIVISMLYVIPKNDNKVFAAGVDNIIARANYMYNITWVPQKNVSGWNYTFIKGKTYRIPYGQAATAGKYIGFNVSVDEFLAAAADASSVFYTKQCYTGSLPKSTYYATDCSAFVSYCWGVPRTTTSGWTNLDVTSHGKVNSSNVSKIQKGDALNLAGSHIVLVTAVNSDGTIEITEQTPPQLKRTKYTKADLISKYSAYTIYRYNKRDSVPPAPTSYASIKSGNYYLKNKSTGTYLSVDGAKAANKQNISVAAKQTSNAFKFKISGGKTNYISSLLNTSFVLNPYSDTPGNGTNVTLYEKDSSGTQTWKFEAVSGGYIIRSGYNESCALNVSGKNVNIATCNSSANQIWILEDENTTTSVKFHRNLNSDDTASVTEKFTTGVSNQKFGYKTDGTGRYSEMNDAGVGFGEWTNPGYKMLGWSKDKNATTASWKTYSSVIDSWIISNAPSVDLYAVWEKTAVRGDANNDNEVSIADAVMLEKWLLGSGDLTNWQNVDLCEDGVIDVFDLVLMRKLLINN